MKTEFTMELYITIFIVQRLTYNIKQQYGFRAKKSTSQAILHFLQYLYKHIDSGNVFPLFLDFRKAFDCVNHEILLSKLNTCGIRGINLDWFRSYLSNREQYVCINM